MKRLVHIDGMWCPGCARALQKRLRGWPGVRSAGVDFESALGQLELEPGADFERLCAQAARLGYGLRPFRLGALAQGGAAWLPWARRAAVAGVAWMWVMFCTLPGYRWPSGSPIFLGVEPEALLGLAWLAVALSLPPLLYCGWPFFRMSWRWLKVGVWGSDLLVALGAGLAWCLSLSQVWRGKEDVYCEGALALVFFLLLARCLDAAARQRQRLALDSLLAQSPQYFWDLSGEKWSAIGLARPGTRFRVRAGERVPLDGLVQSGRISADESLLSGESRPRGLGPGDRVVAGSLVLEGEAQASCERGPGERRLDALVLAAAGARGARRRPPDKGERSAAWVTKSVLVIAGLSLCLHADWTRATTLLVAVCPCALTLAVPSVNFQLRRRLADRGIYCNGTGLMEAWSTVDTIWLDKTGTLTWGRPRLCAVQVRAADWSEEAALGLAVRLAGTSVHPLDQALRRSQPEAVDTTTVVEHLVGQGNRRQTAALGRAGWLRAECPDIEESPGTTCELVEGGRWIATLHFEDEPRPGAWESCRALLDMGYRVGILSGDHPSSLERWRNLLPWCGVHGGLTPEQKLSFMTPRTAMVGDGLNDCPALAGAALGISVGSCPLATVEAADLHVRDLAQLPATVTAFRKARRRSRQCLLLALVYNAALLPAAWNGWVNPGMAALAMGASSLSVLLNAARPFALEPGGAHRGAGLPGYEWAAPGFSGAAHP